jgi:flagellar biosynthesis protein FliQ
MAPETALDLTREALKLTLLLAGPLLGAALLCGLLCGVLQTAFQVHEHSLSFVPKLVMVVVVFAALMPWLFSRLAEFAQYLIAGIPHRL